MSTAFEIPDWLVQAALPPTPTPEPVDDHRVEGLVNRFIAGKQEALFTAPDAFYRLEGADAIQAQPAIADRLQDLRTATLDLARNDSERAALGPRLDLHVDDAADGIDRHIAEQRRVYQRQVVSQRQALIQRAAELEHDNDDKIIGLAEANATAAREGARMDGTAPDSPEEAAATVGARSSVLRTAINERIANGKGALALALFDQIKDQLSPADYRSLDTPVQATRLDQAADQWIARETGTDGPPLKDRVDADPDLPTDAKLIVRMKLGARESADESARAAKVQALDDEVREAYRVQAANPRAYKLGTFARLADAYAAAGNFEHADAARRRAEWEPFMLPFAQASSDKQQRMIDALQPGELRTYAEGLRDFQTFFFNQDAFVTGAKVYEEVGPPVPIDDVEGRVRQARQITHLRGGIPVMPFTGSEIADMRRTLANGSEQDKQTVRDRLAAIPIDMRLSIELNGGAGSAGSTHWFGITAAPSVVPQPTESADGASATSRAGGQVGSPAIEPAPGSPEYQAADADARRIVADQENPSTRPSVGGQGGFTGTEPAPGSDVYRIAEAQARSEQARDRAITDRMISEWASKAQPESQMPPELVGHLDPDEKQKIEDLVSVKAAIASDPAVLAEIVNGLKSRNPPEQRQWAQVPLYRYRSQLSANDFQKVVNLQNDLDPVSGDSRSEIAAIRKRLANRPDTSDLDGFYKALAPDPNVEYSELWPFGVDSSGKIRWLVLSNSARRFLKGALDLLKGTKTGELTPEAIETFVGINGVAGRAFAPAGDGATFAAGGTRRALSESEKARRRKQLRENNENGRAWEKERTAAEMTPLQEVAPQITLVTKNGFRGRIDLLVRNLSTDAITGKEFKASVMARLSPKQREFLEDFLARGATIVGKGKGTFKGGLEIRPQEVHMDRKGGGIENVRRSARQD